MKRIATTLSQAEVSHVLWALQAATRDGTYYGSKHQFQERHKRIVANMEGIEAAYVHIQKMKDFKL